LPFNSSLKTDHNSLEFWIYTRYHVSTSKHNQTIPHFIPTSPLFEHGLPWITRALSDGKRVIESAVADPASSADEAGTGAGSTVPDTEGGLDVVRERIEDGKTEAGLWVRGGHGEVEGTYRGVVERTCCLAWYLGTFGVSIVIYHWNRLYDFR
jgi:hypothetical protein